MLKRYALLTGCVLAGWSATAQTGSVGIGTATPAASAVLDVSSTTKGFLPPRMTQAERVAVAAPVAGLLVYQTNSATGAPAGLYQYQGTGWVRVAADDLGSHVATQIVGLNDFALRIRGVGDGNHALRFGTSFAGLSGLDGPLLYGYSSGVLGTMGTGTELAALTWDSGNRIGINNLKPLNQLDVRTEARTGTHASNLPLYVTGNLGQSSAGAEFRHSNGTQGIGIGYNSLYAAGTNADQHLNLMPKGNGNVGIGTVSPGAKLEVAGQVKITGGTPGAGKVLTSDAGGLATWQTPAATPSGSFGTASMTAGTAAVTLAPGATVMTYPSNGSTAPNGAVTLGTGTNGQLLILTNLDDVYVPVTSASGTENLQPGFAAQFIYVNSGWHRIN